MKALAVVAILIALAAPACGGAGPQSAGPAPAVVLAPEAAAPVSAPPRSSRVGFIGMPPEGAIPSLPLKGELVAFFFADIPGQGANVAWLYEDGRLIWFRQVKRPYGANRVVTGYLEQRLTRAGVESIRSELLSTGLFDSDSTPEQSVQVQVRDGDRLRSHGRLSERDRRHFIMLFTQIGAWAPAAFWADRTIRPYVPSKFALCYVQQYAARPPLERSELLSVLPAPAEELLGSRAPMAQYPDGSYCWDLTTREARAIATPLSRTGLERWLPAWVLGFTLAGAGILSFDPMLPDGSQTCSPCLKY